MKQIFTIALLLIVNSSAFAETGEIFKQYDIEIIIFEDAHARYLNSETWPQDDEHIITNVTDAESNKDSKDTNKQPKDKNKVVIEKISTKILQREYKRINNSSEYEVLRYSAWRQQGLEASKAFDVPLSALNNLHKTKSDNFISGTIKVVLARYLHLHGELEYKRPITESANQLENPATGSSTQESTTSPSFDTSTDTTAQALATEASYPIEFRRRMRSKELHYIDHPLVGILVQINPVEIPVEDKPETSQ